MVDANVVRDATLGVGRVGGVVVLDRVGDVRQRKHIEIFESQRGDIAQGNDRVGTASYSHGKCVRRAVGRTAAVRRQVRLIGKVSKLRAAIGAGSLAPFAKGRNRAEQLQTIGLRELL